MITAFDTFINPEVLETSTETNEAEESCLSLDPNEFLKIRRYDWVVLRYWDFMESKHIVKFFDFEARVLQHEVDHLQGVTIDMKKKH